MSDIDARFDKLPLRLFGFPDMPAVPVALREIPGTLVRLGLRAVETKQSTEGLSNVYTLGDPAVTAPAHAFLFGRGSDSSNESGDDGSLLSRFARGTKEKLEAGVDRVKDAVQETVDGVLHRDVSPVDLPTHEGDFAAEARRRLYREARRDREEVRERLHEKAQSKEPRPLTATTGPTGSLTGLSIEKPEQFSLSWTNFPPVYRDAAPLLDEFAGSLDTDDPDRASRLFWPTLASYGLPYNLVVAGKVSDADAERLRGVFGRSWSDEMESLHEAGALFVIDLTIFESLAVREADGAPRFTPSTITLLRQDSATKALEPIAVRVAGEDGAGARFFLRRETTPGAWLYALQAAKTSITVYGIWLGHVYHWHIVTAALLMTAAGTLPSEHPVARFLDPQSNYLIPFDNVLLLLWEHIAPPTSITSAGQYLGLTNTFAKGRSFFDDDPHETLERLGITEADFTAETPWDAYPLVGRLLELWRLAERYAGSYVEATYADDEAVAEDSALQAWIQASGDADGGNVRGLPRMDSREALARVLTSLVYRITAHGTSRLGPAANPGLSFVANFPPTLQVAEIPEPTATIDTRSLLRYLPRTGTIGRMVTFYFTFAFSAPYEPLLPTDGLDTGLFFGSDPDDPRNLALRRFREDVLAFYEGYAGENPPRGQWPLNIET